MHSRKQYLAEVRKEYERADLAGRSGLLDEAQKRTKLNRKYLIRVLNHPAPSKPRPLRARRPASYGAEVKMALVPVWEMFDYPCGSAWRRFCAAKSGGSGNSESCAAAARSPRG